MLFYFFYFFVKRLIIFGGQDFLKIWEVQISKKKIQVQIFVAISCKMLLIYSMHTVWIQYDYRENELPKFSGNPDPFFWCFEIFFVAFTFSRISKVDKYVDYIENAIKNHFSLGKSSITALLYQCLSYSSWRRLKKMKKQMVFMWRYENFMRLIPRRRTVKKGVNIHRKNHKAFS